MEPLGSGGWGWGGGGGYESVSAKVPPHHPYPSSPPNQQDVHEFIEHSDLVELRKRELLHKNWNDRVYEPIRRKIIKAMNSTDWVEIDRRRRELHRQYLEHVNRKVSFLPS